jgi:ubiquinone/menaquinone biosynthesis C-methylase UbiE
MHVSFGPDLADDGALRLCGDVAGKRAIELGVAEGRSNALVLAGAGAKTIVVDPSPERIATTRRAADAAEVRIEFHQGELADLGFATSASIDLVLCVHHLGEVDDIPRLLRQVHRVLRPEAPFVVSLVHPTAAMFDPDDPAPRRAYGGGDSVTVAALFMALQRANFAVDVLHELRPRSAPAAMVPSTLVVRARKLGV